MQMSCLVHSIKYVNKIVTYITNDALTSKHDCVFDLFDLHLPKRLVNCSHVNKVAQNTLYESNFLSVHSIVLNKLIMC